MLRVAVVDDEPWIARGIAASCDWARHRAEVTLLLSDPFLAVRRIIAERPDIVLVDVNMGALSGLDLMERVREAGVQSRFVVISGHDEFEFARRAMELGAFSYLLKPLKREELDAVMERLSHLLDVRGDPAPEGADLSDWFNEHDIHTHGALFEAYRQTVVCEGWQTIVVDGADAFRFRNEVLSPSYPLVSMPIGRHRLLLFVNTAMDLGDLLEAEVGRDGWNHLCLGLSRHSREDSPTDAWGEADAALCGKFIFPGIRFHRHQRQPRKMRGVLERLLQAFDHPATILPFLETVGDYARQNQYGMGDILWTYNLFCVTWNHVVGEGETERFSVATPQELCALYRDVDQMGQFLCEATRTLLQRHETPVLENGGFGELLRYVEARYSEPLFLSDLAEAFHYNSTYVSDLFRKHLNRGFVEHLTMLRMNRARILLSETNLSITEVAAQCGYADACHFSRQFRKTAGLTPTRYRTQKTTL